MAKRIELETAKVKITLSESGALVVRTFPRSKRFQNIVAIVDEDGVFLVGLFDESEFEKKHFNALKYEEYPDLEEIDDFFNGGE